MHNKNALYEKNDHLVLTYELIFLLQWLVDFEAESLKKLIIKSLKNGFSASLNDGNIATEVPNNDPAVQVCISNFLRLLDELLVEASTEIAVQQTLERNLIPALNQIDSSMCDDKTVQNSLKKTNTRMNNHPEENPQEFLLKELLRRWKPEKKHIVN